MSLSVALHWPRGDFALDVSLEIPGHGITAIHGPSGSGKTTLLRAIAGLERVPGGQISLAGETWQSDQHWVPPHLRRIGYVFQEDSLFSHLDVAANLEFGQKRATPGGMAAGDIIHLLGLKPLLDRTPDTLSGGERQRVAIGRALASHPRLLLMDEPLSGLDNTRKRELLPWLEKLNRETGLPAIYVSHLLSEVAQLADELVLVDGGKVLGQGPLNRMLARLDLPLAHEPDALSVLEATVETHDLQWHLTRVTLNGQSLWLPLADLEPGTRVRLQVAARDVSIALQASTDSSILNIIPATVCGMSLETEGQALVKLKTCDQVLTARITHRSASELDLKDGDHVYAQVKSVALLRA